MNEPVRCVCPFCSLGCTLLVRPGSGAPYVADAGVPTLDYDVDGGPNRGSLCAKGNMTLEALVHPRRLETPAVREGGTTRAASWDEALDRAAAGLEDARRRSGAGSVGLLLGPHLTREEAEAAVRLARRLGTENVDLGLPEDAVLLGGVAASGARPAVVDAAAQVAEATALLVVGDAFSVAPCVARHVLDARYENRRHVVGVLAATKTRTAWLGRPWLRCRPARETAALALMLREALRAGGTGAPPWAPAAEAALGRVPSEVLESLSGLSVRAVAPVVEALRAAERSVVVAAASFGRTERTDLAAGLAALLAEATRSRWLPLPAGPDALGVREVLDREGLPGADGRTAAEMLESARTGDLDALLVLGADPVAAFPGGMAGDALRALPCLVATAPFANETTAIAHVTLPSALWGEKPGTVRSALEGLRDLGVAMPPPARARSDLEALDALVRRIAPSPAHEALPQGRRATVGSFFEDLELSLRLAGRDGAARDTGTHLLLAEASASHAMESALTSHLSWPAHEAPEAVAVVGTAHAASLGVRDGDRVRLRTGWGEATLPARVEPWVGDGLVSVSAHAPAVRRLLRWRFEPLVRAVDPRPDRVSLERVAEASHERP